MPTFEVTIETPEDGTTLTLVVDAERWLSAWREAMRIMGAETPPQNAVCEVAPDESVRISVPDAPGSWVVRPRAAPTRPPRRVVPGRSIPEEADAPSDAGTSARSGGDEAASPAVAGYPRVPESRIRAGSTRSGGQSVPTPLTRRPPLGSGGDRAEEPAPSSRPPKVIVEDEPPAPRKRTRQPAPSNTVRGPLDSTADPLARRLATGDRARLDRVARRVAVPSITPGEEPVTRGGRYRAQSTEHGRPAGRPNGGPQPDELTSAFSALESDGEPLPQQFRAIASNRSGELTPGGAPQRAVENAWQHIPCQLAQTLRYVRDDALDVVAARGERERETLRCRLSLAGAFEHLLSPRPARVKYSEDKTFLRYVDGRGAESLKLLVRSAACAPIVIGGHTWGVLLLLNSTRSSGFAEGELRAISYLAATLGRELTATR